MLSGGMTIFTALVITNLAQNETNSQNSSKMLI